MFTLIGLRWTTKWFEEINSDTDKLEMANIFRNIFEDYITSVNIDLKTASYVYTGGIHTECNKPHIHIHYAFQDIGGTKKPINQDNFKYYYNKKAKQELKLKLGMDTLIGTSLKMTSDVLGEEDRDVFLGYPLKEGYDLFEGGECQPENKEQLAMKAQAIWFARARYLEKKRQEEENRENQEKVIYTLLKDNKKKIIEMGLNIPVNIVSFLQEQIPLEVKEKRLKRPPSIMKIMGEVQKFMFYDMGLLTPEMLVKKFLS